MAMFDDLPPAEEAPPRGIFDDLKPTGTASATKADRILRGLLDPIEGGAQLLYNSLPKGLVEAGNKVNNKLAKYGIVAPISDEGLNADIRRREAEYQASRGEDADTLDPYRIGGNIATSFVPGALGLKGVQAATTGARIGMGVASGSAGAAFNPVYGEDEDYWSEKGKQAVTGAGFGGALPTVAAGVRRVISPAASRNADLALLRGEGVQPTIGQALGGWVNRLEEGAASVPLLGDAIAAARERARGTFNIAGANRVTRELPGAPRVTSAPGEAAVREASDLVDDTYTQARNAIGNFRLDNQWRRDLIDLRRMARQMPATEREQFRSAVSKIKSDISPQRYVMADHFKRMDSYLGNRAASFLKSGDSYQQNLGHGLEELQSKLREAAARANPQAGRLFEQADNAYARLVRIEGATGNAGATSGVYTPLQLRSAIKSADDSVRERAVSHGQGLMQDLARAGQNVIGNKVPDSGTASRIWRGGLIGQLALGGSAYGLGGLPAAAAVGGGLLAYTPLAQRGLVALVANRPEVAHRIAPWLLRKSTNLSAGAGLLGPRGERAREEEQPID